MFFRDLTIPTRKSVFGTTQGSSTTTRGATGGSDDRFDFILPTSNIISGTNKILYEPGTYEVTGKKKDILAYLQSEFYEMDDETVEEYYPELLEGNSFEVYDAIITKASN